jgi:glycosyltransferase involved in cell wall biosynthesis
MNDLTILITTYNRKERLKEMLDSILNQKHFGDYSLIISDNHSNYDVKEMVMTNFPKVFTENIRVYSWNFNTGMSTNISISFLYVRTKWCLFLSDDDELTNNILTRIFEDIKLHPNVLAIKYSLEGFKKHEDRDISTVNEYINYYQKNKSLSGEMIFLSMAYNLQELKPYLTNLTDFSYTYISFLIPVLKGLEKNGTLHLSSLPIIKYKLPSDGKGWTKRYLKVLLGICTFQDIEWEHLCDKDIKELNKTILSTFSPKSIIEHLFHIENKHRRLYIFHKLSCCIKQHNCFIAYSWIFVFYVYHYTRINLIPFFVNLKHVVKSIHKF